MWQKHIAPFFVFAIILGLPTCIADARSVVTVKDIHSIHVYTVPTPRFDVSRYDTEGAVPQVSDGNLDLRRINTALVDAIRRDQKQWRRSAVQGVTGVAKHYRGLYAVSVDPLLMSASSIVVSALLPTTRRYPGGEHGKGWIAVTVLVPSGRSITLEQLFVHPEQGIRALAARWRANLKDRDPSFWRRCVRPWSGDYLATVAHYKNFALTPEGIVVGFPQEPACSPAIGLVTYSAVHSQLSGEGRLLAASVRAPR